MKYIDEQNDTRKDGSVHLPMNDDSDARIIGLRAMTADEWIAVPTNPRQRDTEGRAARAGHLHNLHPAHMSVSAARLPDGSMVKLDGHTRAYCWERGLAEKPEFVTVQLWAVPSLASAAELYSKFDNASAVEKSNDIIHGFQREMGIEWASTYLRKKRYSTALRLTDLALNGQGSAKSRSVGDRIRLFRRELELLDSCYPSVSVYWKTFVATGALLTFCRYGAVAREFWCCYENDGGIKQAGQRDAVQVLRELVGAESRSSTSGEYAAFLFVPYVVNAFEGWRCGRLYRTGKGTGLRRMHDDNFKKWCAETLVRWRRS